MEEKTPLSHEFVCFQMLYIETSKSSSEVSKSHFFFLKNYVTSEGAISHNVLNYQQLPITHYQVMFYAIIILSNYQTLALELNLNIFNQTCE